MQKPIKLFFILPTIISTILFLSSCAPMYQTHYSYNTPHSWRGRQCVNSCLATRSSCRSQCQTSDQSCQNTENLAAMPAYLTYVQQQNAQNLPIYNNVSDYADYSSCSDHCGCEATYRQCFSNCGGEVIANTRCVAFCNQK